MLWYKCSRLKIVNFIVCFISNSKNTIFYIMLMRWQNVTLLLKIHFWKHEVLVCWLAKFNDVRLTSLGWQLDILAGIACIKIYRHTDCKRHSFFCIGHDNLCIDKVNCVVSFFLENWIHFLFHFDVFIWDSNQ